MKVLLLLFRESRRLVFLTVLFGLISGLSGVAQVVLIGRALAHHAAIWIGAAFGFNLVILVVSKLFSRLAAAKLSAKTTVDLRLRLCARILGTPLATLERMGAPVLQSILTDDVNAIVTAVSCIPEMLISATVAIGCFVYLGWQSPIILAKVILCVLLGVSLHFFNSKTAVSLFSKGREERDVLFAHFRALVNGIKDLQLSDTREEAFAEAINDTLGKLSSYEVAAVRKLALLHQAAPIALYAIMGMVLFWAPADLSSSAQTNCVMAILMIASPIALLADSSQQITRGTIAIRKIESHSLHLSGAGERTPVSAVHAWRHLVLKGVTHRSFSERDDHSFMLGPIDLEFVPGELVFLVGGNGSGKTTLAKLLTGLYTSETGSFELDGKIIDAGGVKQYRQLFSAVFSDSHLFEEIVARDRASTDDLDERARGLLKTLELDNKVRVVNGKFSTIALSSGQRKRLALVQAYLDDRPFYVFDEWAADQDPMFKDFFYRSLLPEMKARGKTVLAITHDDRYFGLADRILHLDSGQLVTRTSQAVSVGPSLVEGAAT